VLPVDPITTWRQQARAWNVHILTDEPAELEQDWPVARIEPAPHSEQRFRVPIEIRIALGALGFRLLAAIVGFIGNVTIPVYREQGFSVFATPNAFWDSMARYDSGWYYGIASQGYAFVEGGRSNLAFFPLYPVLMAAGGKLLGGAQEHFYLSGIAISQYHAAPPPTAENTQGVVYVARLAAPSVRRNPARGVPEAARDDAGRRSQEAGHAGTMAAAAIACKAPREHG